MKKIFITLTFAMALCVPSKTLFAQQVTEDNFQRLGVRLITPDFKTVDATQNGYSTLYAPGYLQGGTVGSPSLPVYSATIEVPYCDSYDITVEKAVYDTLDLGLMPMPLQAPLSKSHVGEVPFEINKEVYNTDAFVSLPLAQVHHIGVARDRNLAVLTLAPVAINPVSGKVVVCRNAEISISYRNADEQRSLQQYSRYHSPAFSIGQQCFNNLFSLKGVSVSDAQRMVIVVPQQLDCANLRNFANWKRKQGMIVDYMIVPRGTRNDTIAANLKKLYTNATDEMPAPVFVLLVGDAGQLAPFESRVRASSYIDNEHITDLYFATWTSGDDVPDSYQGRFSCSDTATLARITDKTHFYENYEFPDDSYLSRAALVSGVATTWLDDPSDAGYQYCDPTMDYIARHYVNANNGFSEIKYYKNNVNRAPEGVTVTGNSHNNSAATALRNFYNVGAGWINYSAHGDWDEWTMPSFTTNDVPRMANNNMPSVMIGNCCLSNKFDKPECFGEALLRRNSRAGAVAYIGATNSTLWEQDFNWAVGVRTSISSTMSTNYDAQHRGCYDWLFHTHGESREQQAMTIGQVVVTGNMSVTSATYSAYHSDASFFFLYYWEIYELMGDPSLMPWLGRAKNLPVRVENYDDLWLTTVPGAYVAVVSDTFSLLFAGYTGENGAITLPSNIPADAYISITAQGYKPYSKRFGEINVGIDNVDAAKVSVFPNPATHNVHVQANGLRQVDVIDFTGRTVRSSNNADFSVQGLAAGVYLLRVHTDAGVTVSKLAVR